MMPFLFFLSFLSFTPKSGESIYMCVCVCVCANCWGL